jgi:hypothetical protein
MELKKERWISKFELKPGSWVYVPTEEVRKEGKLIILAIRKKWHPPLYFYHFRKGGHIAALKKHLNSRWLASIDLKHFFESTNKSRITRSLKEYFPYDIARDIAQTSTVCTKNNGIFSHHLPFGFVQSPILATICLHKSSLGKMINLIQGGGKVKVSIYMDDIIISSNDYQKLVDTFSSLLLSAKKSNYEINEKKLQIPCEKIEVFNISIYYKTMESTPKRLSQFLIDYYSSQSEEKAQGIYSYIKSVNFEQAKLFR